MAFMLKIVKCPKKNRGSYLFDALGLFVATFRDSNGLGVSAGSRYIGKTFIDCFVIKKFWFDGKLITNYQIDQLQALEQL